jgi:hypothetical protein
MGKGKVMASKASNALYRKFWKFYEEQYPNDKLIRVPPSESSRWRPVGTHGLYISQAVRHKLGGGGGDVFLRGEKGEQADDVYGRLFKYKIALEDELKPATMTDAGHGWVDGVFFDNFDCDLEDRENWARLAEWLHDKGKDWAERVRSVVE